MAVLTTAGYLFLLLGAIFLAYWLLKRFGFSGTMSSGKNGPKLVSRLMLGNRQSVAVVRYRDREMVLGVTADHISLLTEGRAQEDGEAPPVPAASFASFLKRSGNDADRR
ncbi:MAG: flagellar biosynthetic protein FliO [Desulfovibrionaceae bacterium]|nr:flagellar biosynthetic protein FliO [Desulfovibrionaceae bacterium]